MPQETKSIAHQTEHENLHGLRVDSTDAEVLRQAIQMALDYRGDVTITRRSSGERIDCFIFDVKTIPAATADGAPDALIRAMPRASEDAGEKIAIPFADIDSLAFTGRDTAAGKSFETWMKKYVEKKLAGEEASIHSESLD